MSTLLKTLYLEKVKPKLQAELQLKNATQVPKILKVTLNARLSSKKDPKFIETLTATLEKITGQKPVITKSRKSISGFKLREGQTVGAMVTLRGPRMWDFLDKLVHVAFPRIRDFRGIGENTIDNGGNFNVGFREHMVFPEVESDAIDSLHGLQVTITTSAGNRAAGLKLFHDLGFPFKKKQ